MFSSNAKRICCFSTRTILFASIALFLFSPTLFAVTPVQDSATDRESAKSKSVRDDFYAPGKLVNIKITMSDEDWAAIRIVHRIPDMGRIADDPYEYVNADVEIDGTTFKSVGVRKKGFFGSVVSTKPSLKIRFDKFDKKQFFRGLDQLTLNNNVQDTTNLHQFLAYQIFESAGVPTPRCNLAVVTVNGEKLGVYSNLESIRNPFLKRVFNEDSGRLYEGYAGDFGKTKESMNRLVSKRGKPLSGRKALEAFRVLLHDPNTQLADIEKHLDVDSFITFWATEVLMAHWDGYSGNRNNYYLYRDSVDKKFHFIPWGADSVFWDPGPFIVQPVPKSVKAMSAICNRLWKMPEVQTRYRKEMKRLLADVWKEELILKRLDAARQLIQPHVDADDPIAKMQTASIQRFVKTRRDEIQKELDGEIPAWPEIKPFEGASPNSKPIEIVGNFETKISKTAPQNPFGDGKAKVEWGASEKDSPEFARVGVYALPEQPGFIRPGYPTINLIAQSKEDPKKMLILTFFVDPIRLKKEKPNLPVDMFCVWATIVYGDPQSPSAERRIFGVTGELKIDQFENQIGGTLSGSFKLKTASFKESR